MKQTNQIRIGIVSSNFRSDVSDNLEKNCLEAFQQNGVATSQIDIVRVPGAMEIPLLVQKLAKSKKYDAIITFGAIVKGKTYHFEQIADECARGCMDASWKYSIPVIFEVLAVYDLADALDRATRQDENKGIEAAETALRMIELMNQDNA